MMPLTRSIPLQETYYTQVIEALTTPKPNSNSDHAPPLRRMPNDEYNTFVVVDTIAEPSLAVYGDNLQV